MEASQVLDLKRCLYHIVVLHQHQGIIKYHLDFQYHLDSMVDHGYALPLCCGVILEAIQDAASSISSQASLVLSMEMNVAVSTLLNTVFQTLCVDDCGMTLFSHVLPILQMLKEITISSNLLFVW